MNDATVTCHINVEHYYCLGSFPILFYLYLLMTFGLRVLTFVITAAVLVMEKEVCWSV